MKPLFANGAALLAALTWGISGVPQKTVLQHLDPISVTGLTCLLGFIVVYPLARREYRVNGSRDIPQFAQIMTVALPFTIGVTLSQIGYGLTSVTNAGFFTNTAAVITPFAAWVVQRRRPNSWIFPASALTGMGLLLMGGGVTALTAGDLVCLCAAIAFSLWLLALGDHVGRFRNPKIITCAQLLVAGACCTMLGPLTYGMPTAAQISAALPELLVIGMLSKGAAFLLNSSAQQHVHPAAIAILISTEAVFGSAIAVLWINETLSLMQVAGAVLVVCGVFLVCLLQIANTQVTSHRPK